MSKNQPFKDEVYNVCKQLDIFISRIQNDYSFNVFLDVKELRNSLKDKKIIDNDIQRFESAIKQLFLAVEVFKHNLAMNFDIKGLDLETDTNVNISLEDFDENLPE